MNRDKDRRRARGKSASFENRPGSQFEGRYSFGGDGELVVVCGEGGDVCCGAVGSAVIEGGDGVFDAVGVGEGEGAGGEAEGEDGGVVWLIFGIRKIFEKDLVRFGGVDLGGEDSIGAALGDAEEEWVPCGHGAFGRMRVGAAVVPFEKGSEIGEADFAIGVSDFAERVDVHGGVIGLNRFACAGSCGGGGAESADAGEVILGRCVKEISYQTKNGSDPAEVRAAPAMYEKVCGIVIVYGHTPNPGRDFRPRYFYFLNGRFHGLNQWVMLDLGTEVVN